MTGPSPAVAAAFASGLLGLALTFGLAYDVGAAPSTPTRAAEASPETPGVARPTPPRREVPQPLGEGPVEVAIRGGECQRYRSALATGQALRLIVDQRGADVAISISPEDGGGEPLELDSPVSDDGRDGGTFVARASGDVEVEVCSQEAAGTVGRYTIRREALRPATLEDRRDEIAYRRYAEGRDLVAHGSDEDARAAFQRATEEFSRARDARGRAWSLYKLGQVASSLRDPEAAQQSFRSAAAIHRELGEWRLVADRTLRLARSLDGEGRSHQALAAYQEALRAARCSGAPKLIRDALESQARIQTNLGDAVGGLASYRELRALRHAAGDLPGEIQALEEIGVLHQLSEEATPALAAFGEALRIARENGLREQEAECLGRIGAAELDRGQARRALWHLEQARAAFTAAGSEPGRAWLLRDLGRAYRRLGHYPAARLAFGRAIAAAPNGIFAASTRIDLAHLEADQGHPEQAIAECRRALPVAKKSGQAIQVASALDCIAHNEKAAGRPAEALAAIREAVARVEAFRGESAALDQRAALLAGKRDYYELWVELLLETRAGPGDETGAERAFEAADRSKARSLLDGLEAHRRSLEESLDPKLSDRKAELAGQMEKLESRLLGGDGGSASAAEEAVRRRELASLRQEYDLVQSRILAGHPGWKRALDVRPASLAAIRSGLLDDDTQIVEYFLGKERSTVWVVGRKTLVVRRLASQAVIERLAESAASLLAQSHETTKRQQAALVTAELSREVLAPIAGALTAHRLVLVKDGALHRVPFAALPVAPPSDNELLGEGHELVEVPSASTALALRRARHPAPAASDLLAIFADPVFGPNDPRLRRSRRGRQRGDASVVADPPQASGALNLEDLPRLTDSRTEAQAIASLVPPNRRLVALGFQATRSLALSSRLRSFRIIHFATHGVVEPAAAGLVLSLRSPDGRRIDGFLRQWEIYDLGLSADLVVLSACRSGVGEYLPGEGELGLARAFLWAGASSVLVSLWDVDDRATAELMRRFYRGLLTRGESPAQALERAQQDLRSQPEWHAPHYWAGFVLEGNWKKRS